MIGASMAFVKDWQWKLMAAVVVIMLPLSIYFGYTPPLKSYFGILVIAVLFVVPLLLYWLAKNWHSKSEGWRKEFSSKFLHKIKVHAERLILLYFFSASVFVAVISPIFVEHAKEHDSSLFEMLGALPAALNHAGLLLPALIIPVIVVSILADTFIKRAGQYNYYLGGIFDPATGEENINLRYATFVKLVESFPSSVTARAIGEEVGGKFGERLLAMNPRLDRDSSERLSDFCAQWTKADEKAGWCQLVGYSASSRLLSIDNSFAHRHLVMSKSFEVKSNNNICQFLMGYVSGVIKSVSPKAEIKPHSCEECSSGSAVCNFTLKKNSESA